MDTTAAALGGGALRLAGVRDASIAQRVLAGQAVLGLALALMLAALLLLYRRRRRRPVGDSLLLTGVSGAGKTVLLQQLDASRGGALATHTSMEPNVREMALVGARAGAASVRVVDVPGHPRLRDTLHAHTERARVVLFLLDATQLDAAAYKGMAAERLYQLLADPAMARARTPVVVVFNKQDRAGALPAAAGLAVLLRELALVNASRLARLGETAGAGAAALVPRGTPFEWGALPSPVTACAAIAQSADGVSAVAAAVRALWPGV